MNTCSRSEPFIVLKSTQRRHFCLHSRLIAAPSHPFGKSPRFACIHTFAGYYGNGICISLCREKRIIAGTWIKTVRIRSFQGSTREPGPLSRSKRSTNRSSPPLVNPLSFPSPVTVPPLSLSVFLSVSATLLLSLDTD